MELEQGRLAYTYQEAAAAVGVSVDIIRRAVARGDLVPRYPSSRPVLPASEMQAWLEHLPTEPPGR